MSDSKDSRFKSYIDETDLETVTLNDAQRTKLKDGETIVSEAPKVMLYTPLTDRKKGILGVLTVTTFKLSFASADIENNLNECYQHNLLLAPFEICLSSIDHIYQITDRSRKKLSPGQNISSKIKDIYIICKNMKVLEFSFKHAERENAKNVLNALLHHAYPKRHSLLFAYEYREPYYNRTALKEARFFRCKDDWKRELDRTKCQNWRISVANLNYQLSPALTTFLVVPQSVTDATISTAVRHFKNAACPTWVWGSPNGAALVRMADLLPAIVDRMQENIMLEHIRKSHPEKKQPHIIDLTKECPSPKEVQASYLKLRELCAPESTKTFKTQDFKFYGLLDGTKWLSYVSVCLGKAAEAAEKIAGNNTVVLQEGNGYDMNCVISSLVQILLDPFWRTKYGFQSLIQKDWVAMGHPFANRLGHILNPDIEESPLFLLFLDCVWQLLQQFPRAFQINETYLTTVWDSAHISIFETFLFNCEHDRTMAERGSTSAVAFRSVWDWSEQFLERDIMFFCNPLFDDAFVERLKPVTGVSGLDVWVQCYFRWLPDIEIRNGGRPQVDLCSRIIASEIFQLKQAMLGDVNGKIKRTKEEHLELLKKVNSFFPFSYNHENAGSLEVNNILLTGDVLETQSILNLNNE